ncbi:hypothetical protein HETIRDRAFT_447478 [Heterobasidion irregulare TC 32-1]|uniref:DRBM domain-containing protein n=1 Tax=Heterobasidion irregulare (strain TC 32-1) TaxID=747525 RepID=W4KMA3_HETIT|nr:uncharacterized protein HETIRDRAFT_447478 [Heterobasidion irregulare TC 32-1]ETW86819.1 hypothetical protein HETIRDRAFT_447478 [Heterobasidion irregulare TC 32-1]
MSQNDSAVLLNNHLQSTKQVHLLQWRFDQVGPLDHVIHHAIAYLGGREIGRGHGNTRNEAKRNACAIALQTLGAA